MEASTIVAPVKSKLIKRIIIRSARLPLLYLLIGICLSGFSYLDNIYSLPRWQHLLEITDKVGSVMIALALLTFLYNLIVAGCKKSEKAVAENHSVAALIISSIRKGLRIIYVLAAVNLIIILSGPNKFYLLVANNILNTLIIGSLGWIAIQILYTGEAILYQQMMTLTRKDAFRAKAFYTKMHIIRNIATVMIVIITIAAILMSFNTFRNIGISILASAGFLTAIVGLAAQKTLSSLFYGLQIALSQPIKIGDIVVVENATGLVEEITFTYVTLKLGDRRRLIVPINYFLDKPFENWSREPDSLRSIMTFYIDYLLPITPLREELERILNASTFWDKKFSKIQVTNLTDRAVEVGVQISAANADDLSDLRAELREKLLEYIRANYPEHFPKVRFDMHPEPAIKLNHV